MMTVVAATLLTLATVGPDASAAGAPSAKPAASSNGIKATSTLATALPTPGAWALMGMGGLALVRARRVKR